MKKTSKMSRTVSTLERMFNVIDTELFGSFLPETVITVQHRPDSYGHSSTRAVWKKSGEDAYELNISDWVLALPIEETLDTMIHECVHLYCKVKGIQDVSNNGYYHNKRFKEEAERVHLKCAHAGKYGWNTEATGNDWLIEFALAHDWSEFQTFRPHDLNELLTGMIPTGQTQTQTNVADGGKKTGSYIRWKCPGCGNIIRSTKKVNVICGDCQVPFIET